MDASTAPGPGAMGPSAPEDPSGGSGTAARPKTEQRSWGPQPASDSEEFTRWTWVTSASTSTFSTTTQW